MDNANLMVNCLVFVFKSSSLETSLNIQVGEKDDDWICIAGNSKTVLEATIREHLCKLLGYSPDEETEKSRQVFLRTLDKALEPMGTSSEIFMNSIASSNQAQNNLDRLLYFTRNKMNPMEYIESSFLP